MSDTGCVCTILAAFEVWPDTPLLIAANRDERLGRASEGPRSFRAGELCERAVVAPRDLVAGGTWLGIADTGLFVGITNRRSVADPRRRSRGELVSLALGAGERSQARSRIEELHPRDYNPFHLLLADRSGGDVLWSDGERLHHVELGPGVHWVTERSFGAGESRRHARLDQWARELAVGPRPSVEDLRRILADHDRWGSEPPPAYWIGLDAMCVHANPLDYGTRSSTLVRLGPAGVDGTSDVELYHAAGKPCVTAFEDQSSLLRRLFAASDRA